MRRAKLGGKANSRLAAALADTYITSGADPGVTCSGRGVELVTIEGGFFFRPLLQARTQERVTPQDVATSHDGLSPTGALDTSVGECEVVLTHLWDYLDGHCSEGVADRIIAHVPACTPCTRHLLIQEQFFSSLAELRERWAAPSGLRESVRISLEAERGTHPRD